MNILTRLNRRLYNISEAEGLHGENPDQPEGSEHAWKNPMTDPRKMLYDRQRAEDALYHTIQPLTDDARWVNAPWKGVTEPPPEFEPGGPAPKWTPTEVIVAMAGDPSLLHKRPEDLAKIDPVTPSDEERQLKDRWRPGYGQRGGAPIYRVAKKIARQYNRDYDKGLIGELYGFGLTQLAILMQPGYDIGWKTVKDEEGNESIEESPFISYVMAPIAGAMRHGIGGSKQAKDAIRTTEDNTTVGMRALMKKTDPEEVRRAANAVKGKYRLEKSHDKNEGNPFGAFSAPYYQIAMDYAAALESGDEDRVEAMRDRMWDFVQNVRDWSTPIRGISTGAGQAITTGRKSSVDIKSIHDPQKSAGGEEEETTLASNLPGGEETDTSFDSETIKYILDIAINNDLGRVLQNSVTYQKMAENIFYRDREEGYREEIDKWKEEMEEYKKQHERYQQNQKMIQRKQEEKAELEAAGKDASHVEVPDPIPEPKAPKKPEAPVRPKAQRGKIKIGGAMTGNELRHAIRVFGPVASDYPGRGAMRENTNIPRDAKGWWQPGEDPEMEPVPEGGTWTSIWMRDGCLSMAGKPTAIVKEFTQEVHEFDELGIPSARAEKVVGEGKAAMSKIAAGKYMKSAMIKVEIIKDIHKYELGLGESIQRDLPILEGTTPADRYIIAEACDWMVKRLANAISEAENSIDYLPTRRISAEKAMVAQLRCALAEKAPPGWKGSVKAMKKHTDTFSTDEDDEDKINPYALAWSMHKKGAKPHYKDSDKAEKKKEYQNEDMEARLRRAMVEMAPPEYKGLIHNMQLTGYVEQNDNRISGNLPTRGRACYGERTMDEDQMKPVDALQHITE